MSVKYYTFNSMLALLGAAPDATYDGATLSPLPPGVRALRVIELEDGGLQVVVLGQPPSDWAAFASAAPLVPADFGADPPAPDLAALKAERNAATTPEQVAAITWEPAA